LEVLGGGGGALPAAREHAAWLVSNLLQGCSAAQLDAVAALGAARALCGALTAWVADTRRERSRALGGIALDALAKLRREFDGSRAGGELLMGAGAGAALEGLVDYALAQSAAPAQSLLLRATKLLRSLACGVAPRRVFFVRLPPAAAAARAASCSECWLAAPRRACPGGGGAHALDVCAICYAWAAPEDARDAAVFACGHLLHADCVRPWLEKQTRKEGRTVLHKKGSCPVCAAVVTRAVRAGSDAVEECWVDITSLPPPLPLPAAAAVEEGHEDEDEDEGEEGEGDELEEDEAWDVGED
jgi:hypothetical protein